MPTLTIFIQHNIGGPSHSNQTSKVNKKHTNWKGKIKLALFADDIILYVENPKDSSKKLRTNEFTEVAVYKVNIEISCISIHY